MTKTELRKKKKSELLKMANAEKLKLPKKILKPELVDMLYQHFLEKKKKKGKKKPAAGKGKAAKKRKARPAGRGRKASKSKPAGKSLVPEEPEYNGRTIRQKAVSGKYYLEKESGRVVLKEERENLPAYDTTRIETMVRDPRCIFTYWEISPRDMKSMADSFGKVWNECRLVLRIYNFGEGGQLSPAFDIDIPFETKNWYIDVYPDTRYQVGVGVISPEGIYTEIALSREVQTPRESVSEHQDEKWARPGDLIERIISASGDVYFRSGAGGGTSGGMPVRNISSESVSSFGGSGSAPPKNVLNAELVIHGVAGRNTTISLNEDEIIPGRDGSFTIRMELPDGEVVIPIKFLSDGEIIEKNIVASINTREPSED